MKKILALLLAAVMVFGIVPVASLAAERTVVTVTADTYTEDEQGNPISSVTLGGNKDYKIPEGENVVIGEDQTWTVTGDSNLYVYGSLAVKGKLIADGCVTGIGEVAANGVLNGTVTVKCWSDDDGVTFKTGTVSHPENVCNNEDANHHRYFAEIHMPALSQYPGFTDPEHTLRVRYLCSETGSQFDYLYSDVFFPQLEQPEISEPKWNFETVYTDPQSDVILTARLNHYLFLYYDFVDGAGKLLKKYDGNRMTTVFNRAGTDSVQGVFSHKVDGAGYVEFLPTAIARAAGASYSTWKDSYFLRQERIYVPTGTGYTAYGVNGEISANDQTVRLNYGDEFKFRVDVDSAYSDSAYEVYLVRGYKWDERNHDDTLEALCDEVYLDENGTPQHYVWKFENYKDGEQQAVYIDQYGVYHIPSVEDEYTIMVTGVVSNETLSIAANLMDTIRNLLNAIKQFFERVRQMLGL